MTAYPMHSSLKAVAAGRRLAGATLLAMLSLAVCSTAWAQGLGGGPTSGLGGGRPMSRAAPDKPTVAPPDAVPGARAREPAAPATRAPTDMQPTDALFDAINRGDIATARDAINRGADLNGVNVLGLTPMELSVDLGRNDISFLLLSMRGEDSGRGSRAVGRDAASATPGKTPVAAKPAAKPVAPVRAAAVARAPVVSKPTATPKLFANDGGAPLPSAGFLGFDARSASN